MNNPGLIKNHVADGAVAAYRIVKIGSADGKIAQASAATDRLVGVCQKLGAATGERVDIIHSGGCEVEFGGPVSRGDLLTSDSLGRAVVANGNANVIGVAVVGAVSGDINSMLIGPALCTTQTAELEALVNLTTAQIRALNTTPINAIAAPGAGKAIVIKSVTMQMPYATTPYTETAGDDLTLKYTGSSGTAVITVDSTGFLTASASQLRYQAAPTTAAVTPVENAPVVFHQLANNLGAGDSPLRTKIRYCIIDTTW